LSIEHEIEQFVRDEVVVKDTLSDDEDLIESDLLDSAAIVALVSFLEDRFGVRVDEHVDLVPDNFRTIAAIATFVRRKSPSAEAT